MSTISSVEFAVASLSLFLNFGNSALLLSVIVVTVL